MIKIIGGKFKKTNLEVPEDYVRPTSALKREAIFSILESYAHKNSINLYKNMAILDLYAGSGSVGLEAISRGISKGIFVEIKKEVIDILKKNCLKICKDNQFEIINQDVENILKKKFNFPISIIFIDPPYQKVDIDNILNKIISSKIKNKNTFIVIETNKKNDLKLNENLKIIQEKSYGKTKILFLN